MKRVVPLLYAIVLLAATSCRNERTIVLLSTNDIHARIQHFPQLATAVAACRDTLPAGDVLLIDAGDRWTGNAYVDMAPTPGMPVIDLMNRLGYDAATFGNHEFDRGQAFLGTLIDSMDFPLVCANIISDTCTFPQIARSRVITTPSGVRIGLVGAVTNYEGPGHPAGHASSFAGLRFPDPQQEARREADALRERVDLLVLVSHMGDDRDMELLSGGTPYDVVIGGHTHVVRDTVIGGTLLTQTGKNLQSVGVTRIRMKGRRIAGIDFSLRPLADYEADPAYARAVAAYYDNEELNRPVGQMAAPLSKVGLAGWVAGAIARDTQAEVGFYHIGGVRIDTLAAGGVGTARLFDLEPFGTRIVELGMTPEQMREMILVKYNDPVNRKEAHRVDLYATVPYTILTDGEDTAVDVVFPTLRAGRRYRVAMNDYIFRNYGAIDRTSGRILDRKVTDALLRDLAGNAPVREDNTPRQRVDLAR